MRAETSLPSADPRRKTGDSAYLLQLVLSDKYRHVEQELLFFLGIASLDKKLPIRWSTHEALRALEEAQGIPKLIFLRSPSAPLVGSRHLYLFIATQTT